MTRSSFASIFALVFAFLAVDGFGRDLRPPDWAMAFLKAETSNSYKANSTVREEFQPSFGKTFQVKYVEIPETDLHVVDSQLGDDSTRANFFVVHKGRRFVRFFIHPESEELYAQLIQRYGVAGTYTAAATASTRTLLAWPEDDPRRPIFLKLSLARRQDRLGRIVPGWEIRRSVGISETVSETDDLLWRFSGASLIPEFAGAYVDAKLGMSFHVDRKQGEVAEHGLIARDTGFLREFPDDTTVPLFSILSAGVRGGEPLLIRLWKKEREKRRITFADFAAEYLFRPFLEKNRYLLFHQGIIPEFHGQNVVGVLDRRTKLFKHFFHRDAGSMKVDLLMRWVHGLPVDALRSENAQYDFKFVRATTSIEDNLNNYLNDWMFQWGYLGEVKKAIPNFNPEMTRNRLLTLAREMVWESLPLRSGKKYQKIAEHLRAYYAENPPENLAIIDDPSFDREKISRFIDDRESDGQVMELPKEWGSRFSNLPTVTEYGIVYRDGDGALKLALHASKNLTEIQKPDGTYIRPKRTATKKIGYVTGTFDPPHPGHAAMIRESIAQLGLDAVIVIPNLEPAHKPDALDFATRKAMTEIALRKIPQVIVADENVAREVQDMGPAAYIKSLAKEFPDREIIQVMGSDSVVHLGKRGLGYPSNVSIAVSPREGVAGAPLPSRLGNTKVVPLLNFVTSLSSTKVREQLGKGVEPEESALDPVLYEWIKERNLYGAGSQCQAILRPAPPRER